MFGNVGALECFALHCSCSYRFTKCIIELAQEEKGLMVIFDIFVRNISVFKYC